MATAPSQRNVLLSLMVMLALLAAPTCAPTSVAACNAEPLRHEFTRLLMGVDVRILVYAENEEAARAGAAAAFDRIAAIEDVASDWRGSSEVMRLCAAPPGNDVPISADLLAMLACARRVSLATNGGFDVTIGPVTHLWQTANREARQPTTTEIDAARTLVGFRHLHIDQVHATARLDQPAMILDLGGIAQGYAAGEALKVLDTLGLGAACIDISGDIALGDPPPGRDGWHVAVPASDGGDTPWTTITLSRTAISTSGDSEQGVTVRSDTAEPVRESHIMSPESGRGVVGMHFVTVIGPDAMLCDALATGVSAMGRQRGHEFAARLRDYSITILSPGPLTTGSP